MTDDIATIRNHLLPRIATNGTIVCSFCGASDVTDDDHRPGCVILEVRERLDRVADRLAALERQFVTPNEWQEARYREKRAREQAERERDGQTTLAVVRAAERDEWKARVETLTEALRIAYDSIDRFAEDAGIATRVDRAALGETDQ